MHILRYFEYAHLPPKLQVVSKPCHAMARRMEIALPDCEERQVGFRKLLEAKDCFVRAMLERDGD